MMVRQDWDRLDTSVTLLPQVSSWLPGAHGSGKQVPSQDPDLCNPDQWISECGPRTSIISISRKWLEMHICGSLLRPTKSETLGWGPAICVLTSPPSDSDAC